MAKSNFLKEVEDSIYAADKKWVSKDVPFLKKYIGTEYDIKGLSIPGVRSVFKTSFSFSQYPLPEQIKIWSEIWHHSNLHETLSLAIFFWEKNIGNTESFITWNELKTWTGKIDNWAHSDGLSGLYSMLLEIKPGMVLPQLKRWNSSKNSWERRQSIVSLVHYHRLRNKVLPYSTLIQLVEPLLDDENYYVQKGVGWTLREISNVYHKQAFTFMKKHCKNITGVAFSAAAEKLNKEEKEELKSLRKAGKKKIIPA